MNRGANETSKLDLFRFYKRNLQRDIASQLLPIELQPHLKFARRSSQVENLAEGWAIHRGVWCAEQGVVKGVEGFTPIFQSHPFSEPTHRKSLEDGETGDIDPRSSQAGQRPRSCSYSITC